MLLTIWGGMGKKKGGEWKNATRFMSGTRLFP